MQADRSVKFNKIYLLHSLPDGEYSLTSALHSRVLPKLQSEASHIQFATYETHSVDQMNAALDIIKRETSSDVILPLIQIDMHGGSEFFLTRTNDPIYFEDISDKLSDINRLSRFNLLLFLISCEGASFISEILPTKPSPCWGIVSSTSHFLNVDSSNFIEVYEKAVREERGWKFIDVLNNGVSTGTRFSIFSAEEVFKITFRMYVESYTGERHITARAASIQERLQRGYLDISEFSMHKSFLADLESTFNRCKRVFFMIDDLPENEAIYPFILYDIYNVPIIGTPK